MIKFLKFAIPIALFGFLILNISADWQSVAHNLVNSNIGFLIIAFLTILLIYPEGALSWYIVLYKMGFKVGLLKAVRVWIISNTGRYIPGKIWQYIGRVELSKRELGIGRKEAVFSLLLEIFLVITAAGLVSVLALPVIGVQNFNKGFIIFLLPAALILLHPKPANFILHLIAKFSKNRINISYPLSFSQSLSIFPLYILNFLINGLALYFLIISLYGDHIDTNFNSIFTFSGFYAFSWAVGFLSFFAPGGLGVTEITLSYLLSFIMPLSLASTITILYRFLLAVAEFLIFSISLRLGGKD